MKVCLGRKDLLQRCFIAMVAKLLLAVARRPQCLSGSFHRGLACPTTWQLDFPRVSKQSERQ